jgi:hypothetical protein
MSEPSLTIHLPTEQSARFEMISSAWWWVITALIQGWRHTAGLQQALMTSHRRSTLLTEGRPSNYGGARRLVYSHEASASKVNQSIGSICLGLPIITPSSLIHPARLDPAASGKAYVSTGEEEQDAETIPAGAQNQALCDDVLCVRACRCCKVGRSIQPQFRNGCQPPLPSFPPRRTIPPPTSPHLSAPSPDCNQSNLVKAVCVRACAASGSDQ